MFGMDTASISHPLKRKKSPKIHMQIRYAAAKGISLSEYRLRLANRKRAKRRGVLPFCKTHRYRTLYSQQMAASKLGISLASHRKNLADKLRLRRAGKKLLSYVSSAGKRRIAMGIQLRAANKRGISLQEFRRRQADLIRYRRDGKRMCPQCHTRYQHSRKHHALLNCCCRQCYEQYANSIGRRKPAPPKRNDPTEAGVIYALCEPDTGEIRYIGKAVNFKNRMRKYRCGDYSNPHQRNWLEKLKREGKWCEERILETCLFGLGDAERKHIAKAKADGCRLVNCTDGGDSGKPTPEQREANRQAQLKRLSDPSERRKMAMLSRLAAAKRLGISYEDWYLMKLEEMHNKEVARIEREEQSRQRRAEDEAAKEASNCRITFATLTHKHQAFIPLTRGMWARIKSADIPLVSVGKWHAGLHQNTYRPIRTLYPTKRKQLMSTIIGYKPIVISA